jgi:hypothetical protein
MKPGAIIRSFKIGDPVCIVAPDPRSKCGLTALWHGSLWRDCVVESVTDDGVLAGISGNVAFERRTTSVPMDFLRERVGSPCEFVCAWRCADNCDGISGVKRPE